MAASASCLILSSPAALGLILAATMIYAAADLKLPSLLKGWLLIALMALSALACLRAMGLFFEAVRAAPPSMAISPFLRLAAMANVVMPLAMGSSVPSLLAALSRPWLPGLVKLPLMVALRFVPTIASDLAQLRDAVIIRFQGRRGVLFWLWRPFLFFRVFLQPLVVRLIRSADDLALAAELKGLRPGIDLGGRRAPVGRADKAALLLAAIAISQAALIEGLS